MIDFKNKFIFLHIPKCGGTSVEWMLRGAGLKLNAESFHGSTNQLKNYKGKHLWLQHLRIKDMQTLFNINIDNFFKFTVSRNPWSRKVSSFFWENKNNKANLTNKNFKNFVKNPHYRDRSHRYSQFDFICDKDGKIKIDYVVKLENFEEDINTAFKKAKISFQKPKHHYKTKHKHYTEYYDDETKEIVAEKYAKDIEYFAYKFGE
jgi:chondroitin 4-sulfotransferase 11